MSYEDMSDFEVNKLVAINDNRTISEERTKMLHSMCGSLGASDSSVGLELPDGGCIFFDPCNNPSDAWSIILEYGIDINFNFDGSTTARRPTIYSHDGEVERYVGETNNFESPLRAAMICFLKTKDAENG